MSLWLLQLSESPRSRSLLIYTQTHSHHPHSVAPGPFPGRAWLREGPCMAAPGRLHPPTSHIPPAGSPILIFHAWRPPPGPPKASPCPGLPQGKEAAHLGGGEDCWKDTEERPTPHLPLPHLAAPQVLCRGEEVCVVGWGGSLGPCRPSAVKGGP